MADNSSLFKRKPSKSTYKREYPTTIATTIGTSDDVGYQAVVLVRQPDGRHTPALFGIYPTKTAALQRAHYINANFILRNNVDPLPMHTLAEGDTLAGLREKGYEV